MTLPPTLGEVFNSGVVHSGILFTSGHSAPAALAAGRLRAFIAEIIPRGVYSQVGFSNPMYRKSSGAPVHRIGLQQSYCKI